MIIKSHRNTIKCPTQQHKNPPTHTCMQCVIVWLSVGVTLHTLPHFLLPYYQINLFSNQQQKKSNYDVIESKSEFQNLEFQVVAC